VTLRRVLRHSPYYYPAVKLLGQHALARGRQEEGCLALWLYDALFAGASSVHGPLFAQCPAGMLERFRARVAVPRYEAFP
jgi:hypothetical protein